MKIFIAQFLTVIVAALSASATAFISPVDSSSLLSTSKQQSAFSSSSSIISMSPNKNHDELQQTKNQHSWFQKTGVTTTTKTTAKKGFALASSILSFSLALSMMAAVAAPGPAFADGQTEKFKLPPIDKSDKTRCTLNSSTIGQANAARDKLYDLRECNLSGQSAVGFDLSGVIMTNTDVSKVNFQDAMFSKGYLQDSKFDQADFTNAIVDRANFKGSSLKGAIFKNTVLSGTSFVGADLEGADFTEAAFGSFDIKSICKNPTLKGQNPITGADTRETVGCGP